MSLESLSDLMWAFGLPAIFVLTIVEGDLTLLLAGVLAHGLAFGDYSFAQVLAVGTLGGVASDQAAYWLGRGTRSRVQDFRFYRAARPRLESLTAKFGALSIFVSKYTYGLRWAACAFYGVAHMPYLRFLALSFASCFVWVLSLTATGYFFHSAINTLVGNIRDLSIFLLLIVLVVIAAGVGGLYFAEKYWLSKKIEEADPEKIQKIEHAAEVKLNEIKGELQDILPAPLKARKDSPGREHSKMEGD